MNDIDTVTGFRIMLTLVGLYTAYVHWRLNTLRTRVHDLEWQIRFFNKKP